MAFNNAYAAQEPTRAEIDALPGDTLLEFGTPWCGHCSSAQLLIEHALSAHPKVRHLKIEDGRGKPLGRAFGVKLWPTLVRVRDGEEIGRCVRPASTNQIAELLDA